MLLCRALAYLLIVAAVGLSLLVAVMLIVAYAT